MTKLTTYRHISSHEITHKFSKPQRCSECGQIKQIVVLRNNEEFICGDCAKELGLFFKNPNSRRIIDSIRELKDLERLHELELRSLLLSRTQLSNASQFQKDCHFEARSILAKRQQKHYMDHSVRQAKSQKKVSSRTKSNKSKPTRTHVRKSKTPDVIMREQQKKRRKLTRRNLRRQEETLLLTIYNDFLKKGLRLPEKGWRKVILNRVQNLGMSWTRGHLDSIVRRLRRRGVEPPLASILEYALGLLMRLAVALSPEDICDNIFRTFGIHVNPNYVSWILKTESDRNGKLLRKYDHSRFVFTYQYVLEYVLENGCQNGSLPTHDKKASTRECLSESGRAMSALSLSCLNGPTGS